MREILAASLHVCVGVSERLASCDGVKDEDLSEKNDGAIENKKI